MDQQQRLLIDCSGTLTPATQFLSLLAQMKGFEPKHDIFSDVTLSPAIEHRNHRVEGFWPSVEYLLDIRPDPDLLPETPARRAIIRALTELVISDTQGLQRVAPLYRGGKRQAVHHLSILDIAVTTYSDSLLAEHYDWIGDVAETVYQQLGLETEAL